MDFNNLEIAPDDEMGTEIELDSAFATSFDHSGGDGASVLPDRSETTPARHNPFLRVAFARKLLTHEQECDLGRRLGDARQAMTESLARFSGSVSRLVEAWEEANDAVRSPADVLQWPGASGNKDGGRGIGARERMAELALRHSCWARDKGSAQCSEVPLDLRAMFIAAAPSFAMLCELQRGARASIDSAPTRSRPELERTLETVAAAQLRFEEARRVMLESNLRLVFSIAGKFVNNGIAYDDLVQEGTIGLMRAIEKYDQELGFKFSTYASNWIWQAVTRAIANQRRTVRVPAHIHDKMLRVRNVAASLEHETGRKATVEELAEATDLSSDVVTRALNAANRSMSLDAPVRAEAGATFLDVTPDGSATDFVEDIHQRQLKHIVGDLLKTLPPREATILTLRMGLDGTEVHTLEEIGQVLGITRERTRQLQNRALSELRKQLKNGVQSLM